MFNLIKWMLTALASLGAAARGTMPGESKEIQHLRKELEERCNMTDRERLHLDKQQYVQDHRSAFKKLTTSYG